MDVRDINDVELLKAIATRITLLGQIQSNGLTHDQKLDRGLAIIRLAEIKGQEQADQLMNELGI